MIGTSAQPDFFIGISHLAGRSSDDNRLKISGIFNWWEKDRLVLPHKGDTHLRKLTQQIDLPA